MLNNLTGESLLAYIRSYSKEKNKILLTSSQDEELTAHLADFFIKGGMPTDFVEECVQYYVESTDDIGITVRDFVIKLTRITGAV